MIIKREKKEEEEKKKKKKKKREVLKGKLNSEPRYCSPTFATPKACF